MEPTPNSRSPDEELWKRHEPAINVLLRRNSNFIVFLDSALEVDWETTPEYDKELDAKKIDRGKIQGHITCLEAVPVDHLSPTTKRAFRAMLGEAMCVALDFDMKGALSLLAKAEEFIDARNHEQARQWYVWASACTTLLICVLTVAAWALYWWLLPAAADLREDLLAAGMAGATGALLSILLRVGRAPLDPAAGSAVHHLEGAARVIVGVIGAVLVICAIRAEVVLPQLRNPYGIALACLVAGASERLASGIIERVEKALIKQSTRTKKA